MSPSSQEDIPMVRIFSSCGHPNGSRFEEECCCQPLHQKHHDALRILDEFDASYRASRLRGDSGRDRLEFALLRLHFFLANDLTSHIRLEDEVLQPALEKAMGPDFPPIAMMLAEHRKLEGLTADLDQKVQAAKVGDGRSLDAATAFGKEASELLRHHIAREEQVVFPLVTRFLDDTGREHLRHRLGRRKPEKPNGSTRKSDEQ
jgi:hemerythrin-like domain-containing protein